MQIEIPLLFSIVNPFFSYWKGSEEKMQIDSF